MLEQLIFSWEELPARDSVSQESRADLMTREAPSVSPIADFLKQCVQGGSYGKTSREYSAPTAVKISGRSSGKLMRSGILAHGECWTLNTCEWTVSLVPFLSADGVRSLSDILATGGVPRRYYLSPDACRGILRRAESRGKELPPMLKEALEKQAMALPQILKDAMMEQAAEFSGTETEDL